MLLPICLRTATCACLAIPSPPPPRLPKVADTFGAQKHDPVVPKNAAPHSGALAWVRGLRERITGKHAALEGAPAPAR